VYQISGLSDYPFPLYGNFHTKTKRRRKNKKKKKKKTEEPKLVFRSLYLGNTWGDLVDIWNVGY